MTNRVPAGVCHSDLDVTQDFRDMSLWHESDSVSSEVLLLVASVSHWRH